MKKDEDLTKRLDRIECALTEIAMGLHPVLVPNGALSGSPRALARMQTGSPNVYAIARARLADSTERRAA